MIAGFDRYYQIVKCFRDEDLRADRQPEFTQIDIETSFLDELEIREMMEELVRAMFKEALGVELPNPFPIMTYADAMRDYGSDKPDLRVPLKLTELTDVMRSVDFKVFRAAAELPNGRVAALRVPGRRHADAQGDRRLHARSSRSTARRASRTSRSTTRRSRTRKACSRRSSSSCRPTSLRTILERTRRRERRPHLLRRRPRESRQRRARRAALAKSATSADLSSRAGSRCGWSTSRCSSTTTSRRRWAARHHPFTAPKDGHEELFATDPGRRAREGLRRRAERLGNRRRLGAYSSTRSAGARYSPRSASAPRTSGASSASCSTRCSTARRRTAASRSASTAS